MPGAPRAPLFPLLCRHIRRLPRGREGGREGEREGGREEGRIKAIISQRLPPNRARNSVQQATGGQSKLYQKQTLGHGYLEQKYWDTAI